MAFELAPTLNTPSSNLYNSVTVSADVCIHIVLSTISKFKILLLVKILVLVYDPCLLKILLNAVDNGSIT